MRHADRQARQPRWQPQEKAPPLPPPHTAALHNHAGAACGGSFRAGKGVCSAARQSDRRLRSNAVGGRRGLCTAAVPSETTPTAPLGGGYLSDIIAFEVRALGYKISDVLCHSPTADGWEHKGGEHDLLS